MVAPKFGIQVSQDILSSEHICRVRKWWDECSNHPECQRHGVTTRLPTRLLQISNEEPQKVTVHLTEGRRAEYACLSYCWGNGPQVRALKSNISDLTTKGILLDELQTTVSDAVKLCKALGIHFLWVDALCIIQDDQEDWNHEATMMGDIYKGSTITLATTDTAGSSEGFLKRKGFWPRPPSLLVNWTHGPTGIKGYLGLKSLGEDPISQCRPFDRFRAHSPWYDRGWTMQEWLLSPRILCISHRGTTWDCLHYTRSEYDPDERWTSLDNSRAGDQDYGGSALSRDVQSSKPWLSSAMRRLESSYSIPQDGFERSLLWADLVSNYSSRLLTEEKDKFPALAGLAQLYLETTVTAGEPSPTYLAGLWWYQDDPSPADHLSELPQGLLWIGHVKRPSVYRAPSWSWASGDGRVRWPVSVDHKLTVLLKICDAKCIYEPAGSLSSVKEGWIDAEGPLKRMWGTNRHLYPTPEDETQPGWRDRAWCETPGGCATVEDCIKSQYSEIETGEIYLLVVYTGPTCLVCLILERVDCDKNDQSLDCFRRLGDTDISFDRLEEARIENWAIRRVRLV